MVMLCKTLVVLASLAVLAAAMEDAGDEGQEGKLHLFSEESQDLLRLRSFALPLQSLSHKSHRSRFLIKFFPFQFSNNSYKPYTR